MTYDPLGGDDRFGVWLCEQSELEEEEKKKNPWKTKSGENMQEVIGYEDVLEGD